MEDKELYVYPQERVLHYRSSPTNAGDTVFAEPIMITDGGMTLRDYFAAKAMQGVCGNSHTFWDDPEIQGSAKAIARLAYEIADAMFAERNKKE